MNPGVKMMLISNRYNEPTRNRYEKDEYMPRSGGYGADRGKDASESYNPHMGGYKHESETDFDWPEGRRYKNGRFAPRSEMEEDWDDRPSMNYGATHHKDKMKLGFSSVGDDDEVMPISQLSAEKWARGMESADGSRGPHWSMDQVKQVMAQHGVSEDPWEFFAAINAMYSDYSAVLKKYGLGDKLAVYVDLAKAFIDDPDAQPDKLARYFQYIVKH